MLYETTKDDKKADYVIVYNEDYVTIKKKVLCFWTEAAIIKENQLVDVLLEEIYGG